MCDVCMCNVIKCTKYRKSKESYVNLYIYILLAPDVVVAVTANVVVIETNGANVVDVAKFIKI